MHIWRSVLVTLMVMALAHTPTLSADPSTSGFESFGAPGTGSPSLSDILAALPTVPGSDDGTTPGTSTTPSTDLGLQPTGFNPNTGFDSGTGFGTGTGTGTGSQFGAGIGSGFGGGIDSQSGSAADAPFDGIRSSDTATEQSRVAEFIRERMLAVFTRTANKSVFKKNHYNNQTIANLGLMPDDDEGKLLFLGIMNDILNGVADRQNEATLLDLRNQFFKIGKHYPVNGKGDGYIDATDLSSPDLATLDQTVLYLDELIDKEQERKQRLADKEEERKARKAAANKDDGGGGGGGGGSSTPPSPLSIPPGSPGQPPQPIKQPQHSPDPSFVENMNRFMQEAANAGNELAGLFPQKQDELVETLGNILKTIPTPPTKLTPPVDAVGILGLQQRELASLVGGAIPPLPTPFVQDPGVSFLSRIQAFAQGNFSRLTVNTLANSRADTPSRYPSSPVGAASLSGQSLFGRTGIAGPRLGAVPNFQELFVIRDAQRTPNGVAGDRSRAITPSPRPEPLQRRRSIQRPLSH
ncbi:MAG: hypothetical protein R3B54_18635 [Bdellovibrionota bacterium]